MLDSECKATDLPSLPVYRVTKKIIVIDYLIDYDFTPR